MTADRTFIRVYELPVKLTDGYCFGNGVLIPFLNVDWFETPISEGRSSLIKFIRTKQYFNPKSCYLVLGDHPDFTFVIRP